MGIEHDGEPYIQSKNIEKHISVANELIAKGFAYPCYCNEQELEEQKSFAKKRNLPFVYNRKCRDLKEKKDSPTVIRFKSKNIRINFN